MAITGRSFPSRHTAMQLVGGALVEPEVVIAGSSSLTSHAETDPVATITAAASLGTTPGGPHGSAALTGGSSIGTVSTVAPLITLPGTGGIFGFGNNTQVAFMYASSSLTSDLTILPLAVIAASGSLVPLAIIKAPDALTGAATLHAAGVGPLAATTLHGASVFSASGDIGGFIRLAAAGAIGGTGDIQAVLALAGAGRITAQEGTPGISALTAASVLALVGSTETAVALAGTGSISSTASQVINYVRSFM